MPVARPLIVLVEDEELIRRLLVRVLETAGYAVHAAASGEEAIVVVERHAGELTLLLTLSLIHI